MEQPLVSICSITYNHAPYIRECLDSFLMQKTDFSFEVIINDDCSTDGTTEIIKEYADKYPDIIKPIFHEKNLYKETEYGMYMTFVFPKARGRYVTWCDADDYWTDPLKLQKQVDFLESHLDYGMVHTKLQVRNEMDEELTDGDWVAGNLNFKKLMTWNQIASVTTMIRRSFIESYRKNILPYSKDWPVTDYPLWIWCSLFSKIGFIPESTAVYRIRKESASHITDVTKRADFYLGIFDVLIFFAKKYVSRKKNWKPIVNSYFTLFFDVFQTEDIREEIPEVTRRFESFKGCLTLKNRYRYFMMKRAYRKMCYASNAEAEDVLLTH